MITALSFVKIMLILLIKGNLVCILSPIQGTEVPEQTLVNSPESTQVNKKAGFLPDTM